MSFGKFSYCFQMPVTYHQTVVHALSMRIITITTVSLAIVRAFCMVGVVATRTALTPCLNADLNVMPSVNQCFVICFVPMVLQKTKVGVKFVGVNSKFVSCYLT